jgi:hypothetical protein
MAELLVLEFSHPNAAELYRSVNQELGLGGPGDSSGWPGAMGCHVAGNSGDNLIVVEVWDSKAAQEEFMEKLLGPALQKAQAPAPTRVEWWSLLGDMHR